MKLPVTLTKSVPRGNVGKNPPIKREIKKRLIVPKNPPMPIYNMRITISLGRSYQLKEKQRLMRASSHDEYFIAVQYKYQAL